MTPHLLLAAVVPTLTGLGEFARHRFSSVNGSPATPTATRRPKSSWTFFDAIAVFLLIGFSGLRHRSVGTDYATYEYIFNRLDTGDWSGEIATSPQELGFTVLSLAVKSFTSSPQAFFWVLAALTVIPAYSAIKRYSLNPPMAIALYLLLGYYATSFNAMRQSMAAALLMLGWTYLGHRTKRFVFIAVLAGTIHITAALAAIGLVLARRWVPRPGRAVLVLSLAALAGIILDQIPFLESWLTALNPRYGTYLSSGETGLGAYLQVLANAALLLLALTLGKHRTPLSDEDKQLAVYVLLGVAVMLVGTQAVVLFRGAAYFTVFLVLLIPNRLAATRDRFPSGLLIIAAAAVYYVLHLTNYGDVVPYQTY